MADFNETLKTYRKSKKMTQADLGKKIGVSSQVVSNWERGYTTGMSADMINRIAEALGINASLLLGITHEQVSNEDLEWLYPHVNNRLGNILSKYRSQNKLSEADFAALLNVETNLVSQIELGIFSPSYKLLQKISDITNYDIDYLTGAKYSTEIKSDPIELEGRLFDTHLVEFDYHFRTRFEELCLKNNIFSNNVSEHLGLSPQEFTDIRWNRMPTLSELLRISYGFNVSVDYLIGRTDIPIVALSDDELELLLNYRDCIDSYKKNLLKRAEKLSIESIGVSSVAADDVSSKKDIDKLGKSLPSNGTEGSIIG